MANPRIKRLQSDYKKVMARFRYSELIKVRPVGNSPPEKYHVTYHVKGLTKEANGQLKEIETHQVEITFPLVYPKTGPAKNGPNAVIKNTAVPYHPNIDQSRVCWGDHWAAADQLHDVIIRIGQIIAYQSHNIKSPLNADAARWTAQNEHRLPVDKRDLHPPPNIPKITRRGGVTISISAGSIYEDEGATAKDELEGSLTSKIKTSGLGFNTGQPGSHTIRYNVKNKAGVSAKEVTRKVIVKEAILNEKKEPIKIIIEEKDIAPGKKEEKPTAEPKPAAKTPDKTPREVKTGQSSSNLAKPKKPDGETTLPQPEARKSKKQDQSQQDTGAEKDLLANLQERIQTVEERRTKDLFANKSRVEGLKREIRALNEGAQKQEQLNSDLKEHLGILQNDHKSQTEKLELEINKMTDLLGKQDQQNSRLQEQLKTLQNDRRCDLSDYKSQSVQLEKEIQALNSHLEEQGQLRSKLERELKEVKEKRAIDLAAHSTDASDLKDSIRNLKGNHSQQMNQLLVEVQKQIQGFKNKQRSHESTSSWTSDSGLNEKIQSIEESLAKQTKRLNEKIVQLEESFAKINEQPKGREPDLTKLRGKELYLWVSEEKYIVVNYEELVDSLGKGNLTLDSFIYHNKMKDWTALKNI